MDEISNENMNVKTDVQQNSNLPLEQPINTTKQQEYHEEIKTIMETTHEDHFDTSKNEINQDQEIENNSSDIQVNQVPSPVLDNQCIKSIENTNVIIPNDDQKDSNEMKMDCEENQEINNLSTISISNSEEIENTIQKNEIQSNSSSTTNHQTSTQNKSISLDSIRELHEANHRESMLFDQAHSTPSQHLLYSSSILLPQSVVKRLRTEDLKYTEADMIIERKRIALESKKDSEQALALQEDTIKTLETKINGLTKLKIQLESENEQMFKLLNDVEGNMQKIADEAVTSHEQQWKAAMTEIMNNSKMELKATQDQLILQKRETAELKNVNDEMNIKIKEFQEVIQQKETEISQYQQQIISLEKRLEANKSEIAQSEDKKMNLLQEYENRIDFYRGLYEEEMKQKQLMKQQVEEEQEKMNELKQQIDLLEKTNETSQQEIIQLKQQAEEQMKQVNVFEHENQSLKLTIQSLVNKNDLSTERIQQLQEELVSTKESIQKEMLERQDKYENDIKELHGQMELIRLQSVDNPSDNIITEEENQLKQQVKFQEKQIQTLKIQLQKKETEVGELLSYVEEILKSSS